MQSCTQLLEQAEKDYSHDSLEKLIVHGRQYVYEPLEAISCGMVHERLCRIGQNLFDRKRYGQSCGVFSTAAFFLNPVDLPGWLEIYRKTNHSAVRFNLKYANVTSLKLVKYLKVNGATPAVQTDDFFDDLLDAAAHLSSDKLYPPGVSYKSTAIVILKLVVEFSEPTNYPRKAIVKTFLHKLKMDTLLAKVRADEIAVELKLEAPAPASSGGTVLEPPAPASPGGTVLEADDSRFKRLRIR
ncbi:MAG: hypothetical protein V4501_09290 [Pseudomonadota bacterium]